MAQACRQAGMSRQNYYSARKERQKRTIAKEKILDLVRRERSQQPRIGTRKLGKILGEELVELGVLVGRDKLFQVLKEAEMLVERKPRTRKTTRSQHSLPVFPNLVKEWEPEGAHEVWVSDLTYLRTKDGFVYASVVMDVGSRKIIGWHVDASLESAGAQEALGQALEQLPAGRRPIHHSDRGSQYCCHEYVGMLLERGLKVSMTEVMHCYENAKAERVIGILKGEYELDGIFRDGAAAREAVREAVRLYNEKRPHLSLGYEIPAERHARTSGGARLRCVHGPTGQDSAPPRPSRSGSPPRSNDAPSPAEG